MLYRITDGTLAAGGNIVLSHFDFEIRGTEKIAVTGPNGCGKTTLLRLIAGELSLERDDRRKGPGVEVSGSVTVGMLKQQVFKDTDRSVEEEIMSAYPQPDTDDGPFSRERFGFESEYDRLFTGFGFEKDDKRKKLSEFSGGEQTKIGMIRLLLEQPDILLLDEPTNHLDTESVEWLEDYLRGYPKAVVMVSHDRMFLDRAAEAVYDFAEKKLVRYAGNYTQFRAQKQKNLEISRKRYSEQQAEAERLNGLVERFKHKPNKASFARSRKKMLERMERVPKPEEPEEHIFSKDITPASLGDKWVIDAEKLVIGYDRPLLEITLRIRRGQKIAVIGPNGAGKTTFIKTVMGMKAPLSGKCRMGEHISTGYFDQMSSERSFAGSFGKPGTGEDPEEDKKVIESFCEKFPDMTVNDARKYLADYLFRGADAYKKVSQLSGGERARLALSEILCARPNFLILDEPTNHMDIPAKETLESAFKAYKGTMLFVSHDRYFVEQVADSLLIFENGNAYYYPFGYEHYTERRRKAAGYAGGSKDGGINKNAALIKAEDEALAAELSSVPKSSTLLGHELNEEDAYLDWKMRLACEAMDKAAGKAQECEELMQSERDEAYREWFEGTEMPAPEDRDTGVTLSENPAEEAAKAWQKACLDWYDVWQEIHVNESENI